MIEDTHFAELAFILPICYISFCPKFPLVGKKENLQNRVFERIKHFPGAIFISSPENHKCVAGSIAQ